MLAILGALIIFAVLWVAAVGWADSYNEKRSKMTAEDHRAAVQRSQEAAQRAQETYLKIKNSRIF